MDTNDWSHLAVRELEELGNERAALREGRACAVKGEDEDRISEIGDRIDGLYARLNREAEQIAGDEPDFGSGFESGLESGLETAAQSHVEQAPRLPPPPPPPMTVPTLPIPKVSHHESGTAPERLRSVDTVVVQHPEGQSASPAANSSGESSSQSIGPDQEDPEAWLQDERLELRREFEKLKASKIQTHKAFHDASQALDGQTQEFDRVNSQAEAAKAALFRFEQARAQMKAQLALAREELDAQKEHERQVRAALAAMETRVRAEAKLLKSLDLLRGRIDSAQSALVSTTASAEQEKADMAKMVEEALVSAERATRQAEEMRDAAERAHQRAQQAIAHAQEVETRSEVREQELDRVIDGLEGQIVGLTHEQSGIEQELEELRSGNVDNTESPSLNLVNESEKASDVDRSVLESSS